jgi:hypothetical protein
MSVINSQEKNVYLGFPNRADIYCPFLISVHWYGDKIGLGLVWSERRGDGWCGGVLHDDGLIVHLLDGAAGTAGDVNGRPGFVPGVAIGARGVTGVEGFGAAGSAITDVASQGFHVAEVAGTDGCGRVPVSAGGIRSRAAAVNTADSHTEHFGTGRKNRLGGASRVYTGIRLGVTVSISAWVTNRITSLAANSQSTLVIRSGLQDGVISDCHPITGITPDHGHGIFAVTAIDRYRRAGDQRGVKCA